MKQFKNYVSYSGNKEQLERYAAELIKAGFTPEFDLDKWNCGVICILSYRDGDFGFHYHKGGFNPLRFRPDQFTEALKAATEPA